MEPIMTELLVRLGSTSVQTAVLVALVWGVCRWLPRLPAATRCRLWWLVALQAVLGLLWSSPLELAVLPAPDINSAVMVAQPMLQQASVLAPVVDAAALPRPLPPEGPSAPGWMLGLFAFWSAGVLLMLVHSLLAWRRSRALVHNAVPCTDAGLQQALQLAAEAHGLRRAPPLKISAQIHSPQLIGPRNPVLLLPARELQSMRADDLDMALTHELVHLQRRDLWWGLLPALAQHLFFFHPLVHLAAREYDTAREEACDSAVVAGHGHCRHDYGRLLLQLGVAPRPAVGVASASPSVRSLKRRLITLQQTATLPRVVSVGITALFLLVGVAPLRLVAAVPPPPAPPAVIAPVAPAAPDAPDAPPARAALTAPAAAPAPAPAPRPASVPHPAAPPAPPAAPKAPAAPRFTESVIGYTGTGRAPRSGQPQQAFVLRVGDANFVDASVNDIQQAQRDTHGGYEVLWVRRGDDRYVIRDPALIRSLTEGQKKMAALGLEQGELGTRQGQLGERMGAISLAASRAALEASREMLALDAAEMANQAARPSRARSERAAAAAREQADKAQLQQAELVRQQQQIARQQQQLADRQSVVAAQVARDVRTAIDQALANGSAEHLRD